MNFICIFTLGIHFNLENYLITKATFFYNLYFQGDFEQWKASSGCSICGFIGMIAYESVLIGTALLTLQKSNAYFLGFKQMSVVVKLVWVGVCWIPGLIIAYTLSGNSTISTVCLPYALLVSLL